MRCLSWLRGVRAVQGVAALIAGLVAVTLVAGDRSLVVDANQVEPALGSGEPWRRLGNSEFRLGWHESGSRSFHFSRDGQLIAGANWRDVRIWRFPSGKLVQDLSDAIDSDCIAFSADGKQLLALERRQMEIQRFDVTTGKLIGKTKLKGVADEESQTWYFFSDDGKWMASTSEFGYVTAWDSATGDRQLRLPMQRTLGWPAVAARDVLLLWGNSFVERYDVTTGTQLSSVRRVEVQGGAISNSTGTLMAGYSDNDHAIVFWDPVMDREVGGKIPIADQKEWEPNNAAISADCRRFVYWRKSGPKYFDRKVAVYDVATGELVNSFSPPDSYLVEEPILSPDGKYMFLAGGRVVFTPVEVDSGTSVTPLRGPSMDVEALSFTPNGSTLIVGSRDKCQAWEVTTATPGTVFDEAYQARCFVAVDDERVLFSGSSDGGTRLLDIASGAVSKRIGKDGDVQFHELQLSDNRSAFTGMSGNIERRILMRWDLNADELIAERQLKKRLDPMVVDQFDYRELVCGGCYLTRMDQVRRPSQRANGSIDFGRIDLVLEDWVTQTIAHRFELPASTRLAVDGTPDARVLAGVVADNWTLNCERGGTRGSVYLLVWDLEKDVERFRVVRNSKTYFTAFSLVAIAPDGSLVATVSERDQIEVWHGATGELLNRVDAGNIVSALEFSEDGGLLVSGSQDGSALVWETRAAAERGRR